MDAPSRVREARFGDGGAIAQWKNPARPGHWPVRNSPRVVAELGISVEGRETSGTEGGRERSKRASLLANGTQSRPGKAERAGHGS
jgi:hypothetical protein